MTVHWFAGLLTAAGTILGCIVGYSRGRSEERKAWVGLVRGLYRTAESPTEFRVEMVAKAQAVKKEGWQ